MFFFIIPVGVDYRARRYPVVTFTLIGINVLVFLISFVFRMQGGDEADDWIFENLWLIPAKSTWYTYLTSLFVHAGLGHLFWNMVYLFLFGSCVEDLVGRINYTAFYLLGGLIASLTYVALTPEHFSSPIPLGGASGAIYSCVGGFLLYLARAKIEFKWVGMFLLRFFSGEFFLPAWGVISFWVGGDLLMMIVTMAREQQGGGVAFAAHVGGFLWGLGAISLYKLWQQKSEASAPAKSPIRVMVPAQTASEAPSIYLLINNAQAGPFTSVQILEMVSLGSVPPDAMYWQEGMTEWRGVAELQSPT